jgi:hypothetical protein
MVLMVSVFLGVWASLYFGFHGVIGFIIGIAFGWLGYFAFMIFYCCVASFFIKKKKAPLASLKINK